MTLLSMCMNLMQEQIVEKVSWIAEELGMKGDGNDEEVVKLSREVSQNLKECQSVAIYFHFQGKVIITPPDKDGNVNSFGKKKHKHKHKNDKETKNQTEQDSKEPTSESSEPMTSSDPITSSEIGVEDDNGSLVMVDPVTSEE